MPQILSSSDRVSRVYVDGGVRNGVMAWGVVTHSYADPYLRVGCYRSDRAPVSTNNAELLAVAHGARLLKTAAADRRQLWSDSEYVLKVTQPAKFHYRAKCNRERVLTVRAALAAVPGLQTIHVRSHLNRKFGLPDFFPHELADRAAESAEPGVRPVSAGPVHPRCLACSRFPCRDDPSVALREAKIGAYPEPCERFAAWPSFVARVLTDVRHVLA